ncbi:hypothetical protein Tco_0335605 [Tanacetum coccineum]
MQAWDKFLEIKHAQSEDVQELLNKLIEDVQSINKELAEFTNTPSWNLPTSSYDDDDDEESSIPLKDIIISGLPPCVAITPVLFTKEPINSLIMEDEHLGHLNSATKSDEFIKSSVENLVPTPSDSEDASNGQCDFPVCNDFPKSHLNILLNRNTLIDSSSKIDSLLDEFAGKLTLLKSIPSGIDDDNLDPEGEIHPVKRLLYDTHHLLALRKILNSRCIETDDYDSEGDILFFEEFLTADSISLPEHESFHFESDYDPSSPRPPAKPPDDDEIEPVRDFDYKSVGDISDTMVSRYLGLFTHIHPTLVPMIQTLLPFSSENVDKVHLLSHRGFKTSKLSLHESPMLISRDNTPNLGVRHLHFYPP